MIRLENTNQALSRLLYISARMPETRTGELALDTTEQLAILSRLHATGVCRQRQLSTRLLIAACGSAVLWFQASLILGLIYFGAVMISQAVDFWLWSSVRDPNRQTPMMRSDWVSLCFGSIQSSACYSLMPVFLWFFAEPGARTFAVMWLMGALLHTTLHMYHERRTFAAAVIPHGLCTIILPVISILTDDGVSATGAGLIIFGIVLYAGHLLNALKASASVSEDLRKSRQEALERQAMAEEASMAKSAFLANMSHEIRTPLNGIIGMADVLQAEDLADAAHEKASIIRESGDLLLQLLNDILDVSKIESGQFEIESRPFDIADIARKVGNVHGLKAREKGVDFEVNIDSSIQTWRIGDGHRLTQILHNLASNALKFTDRGVVSIAFTPDGTDMIRIAVRDSGIGMSKEQVEKIFSAFVQADISTSRRYGGTGLGLSIVQGLVKIMGGTVSASSVQGKGSEFTVCLPLPVADDQTPGPDVEKRGSLEKVDFGGMRILVADDNLVNRIVLQALLAPTGASVVLAENGAEALSHAGTGAFDIVLMDISMPVMDGPDAMYHIRQRLGAAAPPIIAVSAHAMSHEVEAYLAQGFDGYLTKPVGALDLHEEIERLSKARYENTAANLVV